MDSYSDSSFWDNTPAFNQQLPDSEFLALLHKQFPPTVDTLSFVGPGVNPQNLSSYSLPSLTPPSEDSSPSPPNLNQEVAANEDLNELKRKASGEEFSDNPNQKTQHTCKELYHIRKNFLVDLSSLIFR